MDTFLVFASNRKDVNNVADKGNIVKFRAPYKLAPTKAETTDIKETHKKDATNKHLLHFIIKL